MGGPLHDDLLRDGLDGGRQGRASGGRGGWIRHNYSWNRQQDSSYSSGSGHPLQRNMVRKGTTFAGID